MTKQSLDETWIDEISDEVVNCPDPTVGGRLPEVTVLVWQTVIAVG